MSARWAVAKPARAPLKVAAWEGSAATASAVVAPVEESAARRAAAARRPATPTAFIFGTDAGSVQRAARSGNGRASCGGSAATA